MKKNTLHRLLSVVSVLFSVLIITMIFKPVPVNAAVQITDDNFPDEVFKNYISENFDADKNRALDATEIAEAVQIDLYESGCSSLEGINYLTALEYLDCSGNTITALNLSGCTELTELDCSGNALTSLNLTGCSKLTDLYCYCNKLTNLSLSSCSELVYVDCSNNMLTSLDIGACSNLEELDCSDNKLKKLGLSHNAKLFLLYADLNDIEVLNISKCGYLKEAYASKKMGAGNYIKPIGYDEEYGEYKYYILQFDPNVQLKTEAGQIVIQTQPSDITAEIGTTALFSVTASGSGLKYQWQTSKDGGNSWVNSGMQGYNTNTLSVPVTPERNGYRFRCVLTDEEDNEEYSDVAALFVKTEIKITSQPSDVTAVLGTEITFKLKASGSRLKYQWQTSKDDGNTWVNSSLKGYNTDTLTVSVNVNRNGYQFRCILTDSVGNKAISSAAALKIKSDIELKITSQPADIIAESGSTVVFNVTAAGSGLKYQWQTSKDEGNTWVNSSMTGYNTNTLTVPVNANRNGYQFRCIVTDKVRNKVTSSAATLKIKSDIELKITSQPSDVNINAGYTAAFRVTATGKGLKYRWQTSKDGGVTWVDSCMTGFNSNTLSVLATVARNGYMFRCVVTDNVGNKVTSGSAKLLIKR